MAALQNLYAASGKQITDMLPPCRYKTKKDYPEVPDEIEAYKDNITNPQVLQNVPVMFGHYGFTRCIVLKNMQAVGVSDGYYMPQAYDFVTSDPDFGETKEKVNDQEQIKGPWVSGKTRKFFYAQRKFTFCTVPQDDGTVLAAQGTTVVDGKGYKVCLVAKKFDEGLTVLAEMPLSAIDIYSDPNLGANGPGVPLFDKLNPVLSRFVKLCTALGFEDQ